jgi:hypothetical protein
LKVVAAKPTKPAACMTTPDNPAPLCTRERLLYSTFNGADYLIKSIIGKYMFFFYTTTFAINPLWLTFGNRRLRFWMW